MDPLCFSANRGQLQVNYRLIFALKNVGETKYNLPRSNSYRLIPGALTNLQKSPYNLLNEPKKNACSPKGSTPALYLLLAGLGEAFQDHFKYIFSYKNR